MPNERLLTSLLVGAAGSILASIILAADSQPLRLVVPTLSFALLLLLFYSWNAHKSRKVLREIGIRDWEPSMLQGTSTRDLIRRSQVSIDFMGISAWKWIKEIDDLKKMLRRHVSNGGGTRFLLLDPDASACREFESIKGLIPGSMTDQIRAHTGRLLALQAEGLPIEVRYYSAMPGFRMVFQDDQVLVLALYSLSYDGGEEGPQLLLAPEQGRDWSFYYGFRALFRSRWESSRRATPDDLGERKAS